MKTKYYDCINIAGEMYISVNELIKNEKIQITYRNKEYQAEINCVTANDINYYWEKAANDGMREKFMNTIRPLLKQKLGYSYSELICEEKSKILCQRYYIAQEKGETYQGPYLID